MWIIRAILIALVVICVVAFAYFNVSSDQKIDVNMIYANYLDVPLITVVFWSFIAGLLVSLIIFISIYIRLTVEIRSNRKRVRALEHEVSILRNRPIEESAEFIEDKENRGSQDILPTIEADE